MSKNERVMDYLLDRIEVLEKEKRDEWFQKTGLAKGNEILHQEIDRLKEKTEQYEIEHEHIKEIITCNIGPDAYNHLGVNIDIGNNDFKTLLAILDIKSEDYNDNKDITSQCDCNHNFVAKEVTPDAENKD